MADKEENDSDGKVEDQSGLTEYPLPGEKPLKVSGSKIEYIVLVPKGYKGNYPTVEKAEIRIGELEVELKTAKDELASRDEAERQGLITEIKEMDGKLEYKREDEIDKLSLDELKPIKKLMLCTVQLVDKHSLTSPPGQGGEAGEVKRRGLDGGDGEG